MMVMKTTILWQFLAALCTKNAMAFVKPNTNGRKLDDTVAKAQAKILKEVEEAQMSGESGLVVPLSYVRADTDQSHFQGSAMDLRIPGAETSQLMLIDTGSSSIGFCDSSLIPANQDYASYTEFGNDIGETFRSPKVQLNSYGDFGSCANGTQVPGYSAEWYYGQLYKGDVVSVYQPGWDEPLFTMDVWYSIMAEQEGMTCSELGFDGIFGVAFDSLNNFYNLVEGYSVSDSISKSCQDANGVTLGATNQEALCCYNFAPSPIDEALQDNVVDGDDRVFGIHFDVQAAAEFWYDSGITRKENLGIFYAGSIAKNNKFYNGGNKQVASSTYDPVGRIFSDIYWSIDVLSIGVGDNPPLDVSDYFEFDPSDPDRESFCDEGNNCYVDSGTPCLELPLSQTECDVIMAYNSDETLKINILAADNSTMTLEIPVAGLPLLNDAGWLECAGTNGKVVLGFPIFSLYYIVFDTDQNEMTFVDLPEDDDNGGGKKSKKSKKTSKAKNAKKGE